MKKELNKNLFVCPPKNKNVPQNFSQGDNLSPSDQILHVAQTLVCFGLKELNLVFLCD